MNKLTYARRLGRQSLVALVSASLALGPLSQPAYAALTALADVPIAAKVAAHPNIVYTVDDSGSMNNNYLPDFVHGAFYRSGSAVTNPFAPLLSPVAYATSFSYPPFLAADFNHLAYDPNVAYQAPLKADGTPLTAAFTDAAGNQINFAKVQSDPYLAPATLVNLTVTVSVPFYCNSDWPVATALAPIAGDYRKDSGGADCRINGTEYLGPFTNGAPPVVEGVDSGYNYPWQNTVAPRDAKYFWRTNANTNRTLWCDTAAVGWPQSCPAATCQVFGALPPTQPQTCYFQGNKNGCIGPVTYNPAGCNTNPAYSAPGPCVGPECLTCTTIPCPTGVIGKVGRCHLTANGGPPGSGGTNANCDCAGAGCALPACPAYQPPAACITWNPPPPCVPAASANCTSLKGAGPTTLQNDADLVNGGTGSVCRRNNQLGYGAGPVTYPLAPFTKAVVSGCPAFPGPRSIPRNYYKVDSVSFCSATIGVNNDQWKGFGTAPCQSKNDLVTFKNVKYGNFHRTDLVNDGRTFPYIDQVTGVALTRTYTQETINYANWFAYYRNRILAAKTTSSIAFSFLDNSYRVGFHTLGSTTPATVRWVDPLDFDLAQKTAWYANLFAINTTNFKTPNLDAMLRIGNLFESGTNGAMANVTSLPGPVLDPITNSCQNNYHILFSDGVTNQTLLPAIAGNRDATVPVIGATIADNPPDQVLPTLRPLAGAAWPKPFLEGAVNPNTLADVALHYWIRDLRPGLKNDVPASSGKQPACTLPCPPAPVPLAGDVDWTKDVAWWQHVNFSAISFGAEGRLDASNVKATTLAIYNTALNWPSIGLYSATFGPNNPQPVGVAVDDLWHATVNSRGSFVYANSPLEVSYGIASILAGIANQRKSRVGASFAGQVLSAANNVIYQSTIEPGWAGDLLKVQIDPVTAVEVATLWQASTTLGAQIRPAFAGDEPWFTNRRVVTLPDTASIGPGIPFRHSADPGPSPGNLTPTQLGTLSSNALTQRKIVAYLRGGSTFGPGPTPTVIEGTGIGQFRSRYGPLGDITNGQPVVVTAPAAPFRDATDPGYSGFVAANAARPTRIFAPANDGMMHSFDDATGEEVFAYVPKALLRPDLDASGKPNGIQALTFQDGGVPIYKHHFYVDSSLRTADVDFSGTAYTGGAAWHTIVVGGLGKGGKSYYALDVTDASALDEAAAGAKVLWEVHYPDMGYTYGRPIIVKTYAYGWTVIVTSGYNNTAAGDTGQGRIFFLDPETGAELRPSLSTGFGSTGSPSGLAQINGFTKDFHNQFVEQVYGGDLYGNLWRFDLTDPAGAYPAPVLFAKLSDGVSPQPITTAPQIEIDFANGIDRYVFIGTGQLLDTTDLTIPFPAQQQTMYAIRDGSLATPLAAGLPIIPRATLKPINPDGVSAIVGGAPNGWYQDLPTGLNAERIVVDVQADVNTVAYVGTQVQNDPCIIALPANIYAREFASASSLLACTAALILDGQCATLGTAIPSVFAASGAVGLQVVGLTDPVTGAVTLGGLIGGEIPGSFPVQFLPPGPGGAHRFSWRLLSGN